MTTDREVLAELVAAAQAVISHIDGDLPVRGWLRDNNHSRADLGRLRQAAARARLALPNQSTDDPPADEVAFTGANTDRRTDIAAAIRRGLTGARLALPEAVSNSGDVDLTERAGYRLVPESALRWLFGEEGEFEPPPSAYREVNGQPKLKTWWWRSEFRKRIAEALQSNDANTIPELSMSMFASKDDLTEARGNDALRKALEFAEYMAKRAEQLLDRLSTEREESDDVSDDEVYDATTARCEFLTALRSGIYEFRKRAAKAAPQINAPLAPRTKQELIDFLAARRQALGGSVSEHNHRRLLATRTKDELLAQYGRIAENERDALQINAPAPDSLRETDFERGYIKGVIEVGTDASKLAILLQMVLDDIKVCRSEHAENGTDWKPIDLSTETVEALDAAYAEALTRKPMPIDAPALPVADSVPHALKACPICRGVGSYGEPPIRCEWCSGRPVAFINADVFKDMHRRMKYGLCAPVTTEGGSNLALYADPINAPSPEAERTRWIAICEVHAANAEPPHKHYEHTYADGWLDACNEIMWAGEADQINAPAGTHALPSEGKSDSNALGHETDRSGKAMQRPSGESER